MRKLFFDFHSPGATTGLAARFDAERWADRLQEAHAQAVSVFTKCGYGYSFYRQGRIRYTHPHLPEGVDMMGEQIDALHRRDMRAIGYYHTFNSEPVAEAHPDWVERGPDGKPRPRQICMLSPVLEEWMLPHLREVLTLYDLDSLFFDGTRAASVCTCDACQTQFAEATGGAAIPTGPGDAHWGVYVAWKIDAFKRIRRQICETIHSLRPDLVVSFNWAYAPRNPEEIPAAVGALVADIHPQDQTFNGSYLSSYWALEERPFDVMNSAFLQWWGDWGCKPALAMQQEIAGVIANGGLTWIGYQMNEAFDVEPAVMGELGKTLAFVEEREPLLIDSEPVTHVAVLHSLAGNTIPGQEQFMVDESTLRGAHRMLLERMVPHHLVSEHALLEHLDSFKAIIVPDVEILDPALDLGRERRRPHRNRESRPTRPQRRRKRTIRARRATRSELRRYDRANPRLYRRAGSETRAPDARHAAPRGSTVRTGNTLRRQCRSACRSPQNLRPRRWRPPAPLVTGRRRQRLPRNHGQKSGKRLGGVYRRKRLPSLPGEEPVESEAYRGHSHRRKTGANALSSTSPIHTATVLSTATTSASRASRQSPVRVSRCAVRNARQR
jgi:hypothetical protein